MSGALLILLLMLSTAIWMVLDVRDPRRIKIFGLALAIALYSVVSGLVLGFEDSLFPVKFDGWLFQLDRSLGVSSFLVAAALRMWTGPVFGYVYMAMLPFMVLWYALDLHLSWDGPSVVYAYAFEMALGPLAYMFVPACGPSYGFPGFPSIMPARIAGTMVLHGYPNAIPSLHISTAVLLFLFARGKVWKLVSFFFVVGTALATLATGEHYVIDLIVGLPFACVAHSSAHRRFTGAAIWSAVVLLWLLTIRLEPQVLVDNSIALRAAAIMTVVGVGFRSISEGSLLSMSLKGGALAVSETWKSRAARA